MQNLNHEELIEDKLIHIDSKLDQHIRNKELNKLRVVNSVRDYLSQYEQRLFEIRQKKGSDLTINKE